MASHAQAVQIPPAPKEECDEIKEENRLLKDKLVTMESKITEMAAEALTSSKRVTELEQQHATIAAAMIRMEAALAALTPISIEAWEALPEGCPDSTRPFQVGDRVVVCPRADICGVVGVFNDRTLQDDDFMHHWKMYCGKVGRIDAVHMQLDMHSHRGLTPSDNFDVIMDGSSELTVWMPQDLRHVQ